MVISDILAWWYSKGWAWFARSIFVTKNTQLARFFSISEMLRTLFSPFRQDAYGPQKAPINIKLQALGMNLVSRFFGFLIRTCLIVAGVLTIAFHSLYGAVLTLLWPFVPLSPIIGIILFITQVGVK